MQLLRPARRRFDDPDLVDAAKMSLLPSINMEELVARSEKRPTQHLYYSGFKKVDKGGIQHMFHQFRNDVIAFEKYYSGGKYGKPTGTGIIRFRDAAVAAEAKEYSTPLLSRPVARRKGKVQPPSPLRALDFVYFPRPVRETAADRALVCRYADRALAFTRMHWDKEDELFAALLLGPEPVVHVMYTNRCMPGGLWSVTERKPENTRGRAIYQRENLVAGTVLFAKSEHALAALKRWRKLGAGGRGPYSKTLVNWVDPAWLGGEALQVKNSQTASPVEEDPPEFSWG